MKADTKAPASVPSDPAASLTLDPAAKAACNEELANHLGKIAVIGQTCLTVVLVAAAYLAGAKYAVETARSFMEEVQPS